MTSPAPYSRRAHVDWASAFAASESPAKRGISASVVGMRPDIPLMGILNRSSVRPLGVFYEATAQTAPAAIQGSLAASTPVVKACLVTQPRLVVKVRANLTHWVWQDGTSTELPYPSL